MGAPSVDLLAPPAVPDEPTRESERLLNQRKCKSAIKLMTHKRVREKEKIKRVRSEGGK